MERRAFVSIIFNAYRYFTIYLGIALLLTRNGILTLPLGRVGFGYRVLSFLTFVALLTATANPRLFRRQRSTPRDELYLSIKEKKVKQA